ncbi:MAG: hypothetical protein ACLQU3_04970 [Limisphaerales bacterium]
MNKKHILLLLTLFLACLSSPARGEDLFSAMSPKLKKLVTANPVAWKALTNACSIAFRTNTVGLAYFYSEDDSRARAVHYYPHFLGEADVWICVRENQQPWDEFTSLLYELLNSANQGRFEEIMGRARSGSLTKPQFVREVARVEFDAVKAVRGILRQMRLTKKEKTESYCYYRFIGCPDDFEEFLGYGRRVSSQRDVTKYYELQYDRLRKVGSD